MPDSHGTANIIGQTTSGVDLVQNYLDVLLRDVSADLEREDALVQQFEPEVKTTHDIIPAAESLVIEPAPVAVNSITLTDDFVPTVTIGALQKLSDEVLHAKAEREIPAWARHGFAGLVFEVAGLKMAAPLHALGGIILIGDKLQPVAGQADWFMGLLRWNGRNLRVIDTAGFIMPERLEHNDHRSAYESVIVLGDSHWALAVDRADESVTLKADEIRWKQLNGTRPWLAGTLLQRLCALLDVDNLMIMLQQTEQHIQDGPGPDRIN